MSLIYRLLYRIGVTPWGTGEVPRELSELVEGAVALPGVTAKASRRDRCTTFRPTGTG
jgi:hypothetical protein